MIPLFVLLTQVTGGAVAQVGKIVVQQAGRKAGQVARHVPKAESRTFGTTFGTGSGAAPKSTPGDGISQKLRDAWYNTLGTEGKTWNSENKSNGQNSWNSDSGSIYGGNSSSYGGGSGLSSWGGGGSSQCPTSGGSAINWSAVSGDQCTCGSSQCRRYQHNTCSAVFGGCS